MSTTPSDPEARERILKANGVTYAPPTHPYFDGCKCYVRYLTEETVFALHYGAHNPTCPVYHVSLDPVDRRADDDFRARVETHCAACGAAPGERHLS